MSNEDILKLVAVLVALSGWFKVVYDHLVSRPRIGGKILGVLTGQLETDKLPRMTSFFLYPYLVNSGKNPVHILEFELFVKFESEGWVQQRRFYGNIPHPTFSDDAGHKIVVNDFEKNQIIKRNAPAVYGVPLHGWSCFGGDIKYYSMVAKKYKLVCTDAYGRKHSIVHNAASGQNLFLLSEIANVEFPERSFG